MKQTIRIALLFCLVTSALSTIFIQAAHSRSQADQKALLGAIVGGVIGNQVSSQNRTRNTVIGAAAGAVIGNAIGQIQDEEDRVSARQSRESALISRTSSNWQGRSYRGQVEILERGHFGRAQEIECVQYKEVVYDLRGVPYSTVSQSCFIDDLWTEVQPSQFMHGHRPHVQDRYVCTHVNIYGKYAEGGGCNAYGCFMPGGNCNAYGCYQYGGGCNAYGCFRPAGSCSAYGCIKEIQSRPFSCTDQ